MATEENDLLWRLRNPLWSHAFSGPAELDKEATLADLREAAAEIERLRSPNIRRLVIAARAVAFSDYGPEEISELDQASEEFARTFPWEDEPNASAVTE